MASAPDRTKPTRPPHALAPRPPVAQSQLAETTTPPVGTDLATSLHFLGLSGYTQTQVAELLGSSQSRVAKMEAGDPSVSVDLLIRALLALGVNRKQVGRAIGAALSA